MSATNFKNLVTDALGFRLKVTVAIGDFPTLGQHRTYEDAQTGKVAPRARHELNIQKGLSGAELCDVIAHEVYHLFYAIRHLITVNEETQAEVFGGLVGHVRAIVAQNCEQS